MQIIKPTLLVFAVCTAIISGIGLDTLLGSTGTVVVMPMFESNDYPYVDTNQGTDTFPTIMQYTNEGNQNKCVLRRFECGQNALPSCFKRWRSKEINCNDTACISGSCMLYSMFLSKYTFQPWDMQDLQGPFPRPETMCIMQQSDCPLDDEFCISSISLSQVPCDVELCSSIACKRQSVFVDSKDILVKNAAESTLLIPLQGSNSSAVTSALYMNNVVTSTPGNAVLNGTFTENAQETILPMPTPNLGCFTETGTWTIDRTECAANQKPYVIPQVQTFVTTQKTEEDTPTLGSIDPMDAVRTVQYEKEEVEMQQTIEELFVPDTRKNTIVQSLLSSITETDGRLGIILSNTALPDTLRSSLVKEQEALDALQRTISAPNQSMLNLQQLGESVSKHLQTIQSIVQSLQANRQPPTTVTETLDAIFTGLPEVFSLLLQEEIPVDNMMISGYIGAEAAYSPIRTACIEHTASCGDLVQIIDALEPVYQSLQDSLEKAGKMDLQAKIDVLLRQK